MTEFMLFPERYFIFPFTLNCYLKVTKFFVLSYKVLFERNKSFVRSKLLHTIYIYLYIYLYIYTCIFPQKELKNHTSYHYLTMNMLF